MGLSAGLQPAYPAYRLLLCNSVCKPLIHIRHVGKGLIREAIFPWGINEGGGDYLTAGHTYTHTLDANQNGRLSVYTERCLVDYSIPDHRNSCTHTRYIHLKPKHDPERRSSHVSSLAVLTPPSFLCTGATPRPGRDQTPVPGLLPYLMFPHPGALGSLVLKSQEPQSAVFRRPLVSVYSHHSAGTDAAMGHCIFFVHRRLGPLCVVRMRPRRILGVVVFVS